jgi:tetratricopeptide (TPR) repeat protein
MSNYLDSGDSSDEENKALKPGGVETLEIDKEHILELCAGLKASGNTCFGSGDFDGAVKDYTEAVNLLKNSRLPKDSLILLNRSATYLALKRYVPALNDANQATEVDPGNWKGHWRKGVALMAMTKKTFRSKQAVEAFVQCSQCASLPANQIEVVAKELQKARARLERQEEETPPADLSNCAPS